ncbi:hypothetical protein DT076_08125 [Desertihabitans brevis]|uniref:Uncharacterized protein n=1 Tax=Desertihabitans brevis TaxID=2268447 RepID=A0A367YW56_9ACTN|nr:hypothetical protein [Desertihabitans brevis]RCK69967.1 hypothetical protein DT076_08125 [Desertihabitans brevis]
MSSPLVTYLRNHEAAAGAGRDLFHRAAASHRERPWGADVERLAGDVDSDIEALRQILREVGASPDHLSRTALQLGERVGRLKPNGRVLRRSALSDLVEVEGMLDAVQAKAEGWRALVAAGLSRVGDVDVEALLQRAEDQRERLRGIHARVAAEVLTRSEP